MTNVKALERKPNQEIVICLERLLEEAKQGDITALSYCAECHNEIMAGSLFVNGIMMLAHLQRQLHITHLALDKSMRPE